MRRLFRDTNIGGWGGSAIASLAILLVGASFYFAGVTSSASVGERAVSALEFSAQTFALGAAVGGLVWVGLWLIGGRMTNYDLRDTMLWVASLFGVLCLGVAVFA